MARRPVATRQCCICRGFFPRTVLYRIAEDVAGWHVIPPDTRNQAFLRRSTYVCQQPECLKAAKDSKRVAKALKRTMPGDILSPLAGFASSDEQGA